MDKTILIVDDDIDTLQLIGTMLEQKGYKIIAANNGEKALQITQSELPDLIILDVMMPGIDGYEVTRRLRAIENTSLIPIILFSARVQVDDKMMGYEAGADDYLTKPTHPSELIIRVEAALEKSQANQTVTNDLISSAKDSKTIGILSTKGGLGATTLSLNLAIAIHNKTQLNVTLAEFRPGQGTLGLFLDHINLAGLEVLTSKPYDEITLDEIKEQFIRDGSGIDLLLSSMDTGDLLDFSNHFDVISKHLQTSAPYTIIDLGPGLTQANQMAVLNCDEILIVTEPYTWTIIQTRELIKNVGHIGVNENSISIVLINKFRSENTLPTSIAEEELEKEIDFIISPSPEDVFAANTKKLPIFNFLPDSIYSKQVTSIAEEIIQKEVEKLIY